MTQLANTFEGGTDTTTISAANSGGASGDAFNSVSIPAGAELAFSVNAAYNGSLGMRAATRGTSGATYALWSTSLGTPAADTFHRFFFKCTARPSALNSRFLHFETGASAQMGYLRLLTSGAIDIRNTTDGLVATSSTALTAGAWYRIEVKLHGGTSSDGTMTLRIYSDPTAAVGSFTEEVTTPTPWTMGSATLGKVFLAGGWVVTNWPSATDYVYFDNAVTGATDWVGPLAIEKVGAGIIGP